MERNVRVSANVYPVGKDGSQMLERLANLSDGKTLKA